MRIQEAASGRAGSGQVFLVQVDFHGKPSVREPRCIGFVSCQYGQRQEVQNNGSGCPKVRVRGPAVSGEERLEAHSFEQIM